MDYKIAQNLAKYKNIIGKKIKFYTRSFSPELYFYSSNIYKNLGIEVVRLVDQSAEGYFFTMLEDNECDIAINVDEDAYILNFNYILELVDFMVIKKIANIGCPDAGPGCPRGFNPIVTNPFFNILNLELIRTREVSFQSIQNFKYSDHKEIMIQKFPKELLSELIYDFNYADTEPYYTFFLWLAFNFDTLYLKCSKHKDNHSTIVYDLNNNIICLHSWYARKYGINTFHTNRINDLISEAYNLNSKIVPNFNFLAKLKFNLELVIRYYNKIIYRIFRLYYRKVKKEQYK